MTIALPTLPRGATVTPRLVRYGGDLTSTLGGPTQRITRLGSRWAADVQLPTLDAECAAQWLAVPLAAEAGGDTVSLAMPQMIPGARNLNSQLGTGAVGSSQVTVSGTAPPVGASFSFQAGGRSYLHFVLARVGQVLTVSPLLRVAMAGVAMEFKAPKLEGFPDDTTSWSLEYLRFVGTSFSLTENA